MENVGLHIQQSAKPELGMAFLPFDAGSARAFSCFKAFVLFVVWSQSQLEAQRKQRGLT